MDRTDLAFLKELTAAPTPSGHEAAGQALVAAYMGRYAERVERDAYGNVVGVLNSRAPRRIMLAGHCDEIGLMVQHIDANGFLYVSALGGVNVALLPGERVVVHGADGPVRGVIGVKPPHFMTEKEREAQTPRIHELWIDIGARDRADAAKAVAPGDPATVDAGWIDLRGGLAACRGFDDRVGAFVVAHVLRLLKGRALKVAVHAVSTVQEEVGLRGAAMSAHAIDPHMGIAVEVGFASDFPGMDKRMVGEARLGGGPILRRGPTYHPAMVEGLRRTARRLRMPVQIYPDPRDRNNDAFAIQMTRAGVAACNVSVPSRYMHSPVETIALSDAADAARLIAEFIVDLPARGLPAAPAA